MPTHAFFRFARDAAVLRAVGSVLLDPASSSRVPLTRWLVATDAFDLAEGPTSAALYGALAPHMEAGGCRGTGTMHGGRWAWVLGMCKGAGTTCVTSGTQH